jgi:isoleucyl-tRNA synthetase
VSQTRGWFYTLMVLSTALFEREPFKNCICHGVVQDEQGQKLSKRLRNYPDPDEVFRTHGSDALRWYLCSSPVLRGGDLSIDKEGKGIAEVVRLVIHPIWNAYSFFCLYANADGIRASVRTDASGVLDRYVLAKLRTTLERVTASMEAYDLAGACADIRTFLDALNNWYIRRSRPRFWKEEHDQDKKDAYDTLYTVLTTLCRMCSPFLPLVTEEIYRGLTEEKSVHLTDWPVIDVEDKVLPGAGKLTLVAKMDRIRAACSVALSLREEYKIRVRQPLDSLQVIGEDWEFVQFEEELGELLKDETNVKNVTASSLMGQQVRLETTANFKVLGPRLGARMKAVAAKLKADDFKMAHSEVAPSPSRILVEVNGEAIELSEAGGDYVQRLVPLAEGQGHLVAGAIPVIKSVVLLDTKITPELEREGLARDLVRVIQQARKDAKLHISDRIRLRVSGDAALAEAVREHGTYVREQTLAVELELGPPVFGWFTAEGEVGEGRATVSLSKA